MQGFTGILAALPVPFTTEFGVDREELASVASWIASHEGITGVVTNGIAGEVFALSPQERVDVTRVVVEAVEGRVPVISGIYCERLEEAAEQAVALEDAGASGLLVMPPGRWLRYGTNKQQVLTHFRWIAKATTLPLVAHLYPAATKAAYDVDTLRALAREETVVSFKVGTRDIARYEENLLAIREANPDCTLLTCQDEFLLASLVQDVDGAMVGFASFVPELVTELWSNIKKNDLDAARETYARLYPLNKLVYGHDHPSYENYPRMKTAMMLSGRLSSDAVRPPVEKTSSQARASIEEILRAATLAPRG
jgi:4-hydroxy-tetrahydrodipicolinate synthase